ncbi:MAG: thiamine phosphate synthase [Nocardioidaceae bacterium]|nr:thiamine phosphate synthase [Nocardioidaceae bacterium]
MPRFHVLCPVVPVPGLLALAEAGVEAVQVRDKDADDRALLAFATAAVAALRPLGVRVILNDRVDLALAAGADGVHLGAQDLPVSAARALAPTLLIGATCRSRAAAVAAAREGADYAGVGPVFATTSKAGLPAPLGVEGLAEVTGVLPVVAIAGIDAGRVPAVLAAGAHGVAVLGAVTNAADPPTAAREIAAALRAA